MIKSSNPWKWVPSLYYAEGIPYVIVMTVSVIMYKRMGVSNTDIALYTSWLYLPWVIKPLWSPIVDLFKTKRFWITIMQLFIGAGLAGVALTIPMLGYFQLTLMFFWLLAFSSATHDIAADGFYMLGLEKHEQAFFVGIRSTFYRLAMITGQGLLIILAGYLEVFTGTEPLDIKVSSSFNQITQINITEIKNFEVPTSETTFSAPNEKFSISIEKPTPEKIDSLKKFVKSVNQNNGFYKNEYLKSNSIEVNDSDNSFFYSEIIEPFEKLIVELFGEKKISTSKPDMVGNVGVFYFYLTKPPDVNEKIAVNLEQTGGNKNLNIIEGTRFEFNSENWNKPAFFLIQLDPKLDEEVSAIFTARSGNIPLAWMISFLILAGLFVLFFIYHSYFLPKPASDKSVKSGAVFKDFIKTFVLFFKKKRIGVIIAFLLVYRLGESQIVKLASPFLLDARETGGLALTTAEVGLVYGTVGILALTAGGILGGYLASRNGLKYWLWWMVIAINLPNTVYIYLSYAQPESFFLINLAVAIEQFGYGFGFTAYMLFMIYVSDGDFKTAHFAITTGFMALGMMIPGMISGWIQELIGYKHFFVWVLIATIPAFIITKYIPLDSDFGKK